MIFLDLDMGGNLKKIHEHFIRTVWSNRFVVEEVIDQ